MKEISKNISREVRYSAEPSNSQASSRRPKDDLPVFTGNEDGAGSFVYILLQRNFLFIIFFVIL